MALNLDMLVTAVLIQSFGSSLRAGERPGERLAEGRSEGFIRSTVCDIGN
jgi:hypothetical protein